MKFLIAHKHQFDVSFCFKVNVISPEKKKFWVFRLCSYLKSVQELDLNLYSAAIKEVII